MWQNKLWNSTVQLIFILKISSKIIEKTKPSHNFLKKFDSTRVVNDAKHQKPYHCSIQTKPQKHQPTMLLNAFDRWQRRTFRRLRDSHRYVVSNLGFKERISMVVDMKRCKYVTMKKYVWWCNKDQAWLITPEFSSKRNAMSKIEWLTYQRCKMLSRYYWIVRLIGYLNEIAE